MKARWIPLGLSAKDQHIFPTMRQSWVFPVLGTSFIALTVAACAGGGGIASERLSHRVMLRCDSGSTTAAQMVVVPQCQGGLVLGHASSMLLTVSKPAYSGQFTVNSSKPGIVTVGQATAANQFVVTPLAVGSTTLEVADDQGDKAGVTVADDDVQCVQEGQFEGNNVNCTVASPTPAATAPNPAPSR